jgi:uncharacterized Zn finger protein (UPF0148 family)
MPKTAKRPERVFGGVLCSACSRMTLKAEARDMQASQEETKVKAEPEVEDETQQETQEESKEKATEGDAQ